MGLAEESEITHARHTCSKPYQSFQSHHAEFDVLKSQAIEEKISFIRWLPKSAQSHFLLSSNERTIKLWRLSDVPDQNFTNFNFPRERGCRQKMLIRSRSDVKIPVCSPNTGSVNVRVWNKKQFDRAHSFSITGLSLASDRETFISTDALRVNLWHLEVTNEVYSMFDQPLETIDERSHLITGVDCSNVTPSIFAYCTNRGSVRVQDIRQSNCCDNPSVVFNTVSADEPVVLNVFLGSMSDIKMANTSDRFVFTRDFMTCKVWDLNMPTTPVEVHPVQTNLQSHLSVMYESELLCDDFKLSISSDDRFIVSGSYNRLIKVFDRHKPDNSVYSLLMQTEEINSFVDPFRLSVDSGAFAQSLSDSAELPWPRQIAEEQQNESLKDLFGVGYPKDCNRFAMDVERKWLQASWRPGSHVVAVSHGDGIHLLEALCP